VSAAYKSVTKKVVRGRILTEGIRMDGRGLADIRLYRARRMLAMLVSPAARGGNLEWNRD